MNFVNPYIAIYFRPDTLRVNNNISFYKELSWTFLKNIENRLKLFQHRVNIVIVDSEPLKKTMKFGSIYEYNIKLEKPFNAIPEIEKRKKLLDIIYEAFKLLGAENNWDLNVIEDAYLKSFNQIDKFEYLTENKLNRNKEFYGQLRLTLQGNVLTFHVEVNHLTKNITELFRLFEASEDNLSWNRMFKEFGWLDNVRFGLKFLAGDLWIVINVENGQVEEFKRPKKFDLKKIEDYLTELKKPAYNTQYSQ